MRRPGNQCVADWASWYKQHPPCDLAAAAGTSLSGMGAYAPAPYLAWSGWRLRVPGGPVGGQYHGYIASDEIGDGVGWPDPNEIIRPMDNPAGLGGFSWDPWDELWGGTPLKEGETVSDYVYRSPAELRPRANASGGVHTVRAVQTERTAGYAVAPGNYKGIGAVTDSPMIAHLLSMPRTHPVSNVVPFRPPVTLPGRPPVCPAWGCDGPPHWYPSEIPPNPAPAPVVTQPPPPSSPAPAPVVLSPGAGGCAAGQYRDAAGNCTSDWSHPSPLYLPNSSFSPAPAPTVSANTCPTGYEQDPNTGNCLAPGAPSSSSGVGDWLSASTQIAGMNIPNVALAGVAALVAFKMFGGKR